MPLAFYVAVYYYLETLDGWSGWASSTIVIPSFLLSMIYTVVGLCILFTTVKSNDKNDNTRVLIGSIFLSSSLILWFIIRCIVLEIRMSF